MANNNDRYAETVARKARLLELIGQGLDILEALADPRIGVSYSAYRKWRERDPKFGAVVDTMRADAARHKKPAELNSAEFAWRYFGRQRTAFQQLAIDKMRACKPGNIVMLMWPPEYGKTTTFEDFATEQICRNPSWRNTTASESDTIAKRILGRIRRRLEPDGPFPALVRDWGPFRPEHLRAGAGGMAQPWNNEHFNVRGKQTDDERDHTMLAIGWKSSTVSIRTDHLHIDDLQSTKTLAQTAKQLDWFRQDALSRPGESGITTVNGTRVGDNDFLVSLEEDEELDGILEVVKFPAIFTNPVTGEKEALWPEKHTLEQLDRIRRKIKDTAFDRNYLMLDGRAGKNRTFTDKGREKASRPQRRLNNPTWIPNGEIPPAVVSLDPGLFPGITCIQVWAEYRDTMELIWFSEPAVTNRNEDIVEALRQVFLGCRGLVKIAELRIEAMNFQRGLARDERLVKLCEAEGVTMHEHMTNVNKYDQSIGISSMASDWESGKMLVPTDDNDVFTKEEMDEFFRQLRNWKPGDRGNKKRIDRVMAMWFAWIHWNERRYQLDEKPAAWRREGVPSGLIVGTITPIIPIGVLP